MSTAVCIAVIATIILNLIPALYLIDWFVVFEYLHQPWNYTAGGTLWEKMAQTLYSDVVCGIFGGEIFVSPLCVGISIISIEISIIFAILGIARKRKKTAIYFLTSIAISILEIVLSINIFIDAFLSV